MNAAEIKDKVYANVSEQLGVGLRELTDNSDFVGELGADSLDLVELAMAFEEEFNVEISDEEFGKLKTVGDVIGYIVSKKA
jgi:acyl carrier protein